MKHLVARAFLVIRRRPRWRPRVAGLLALAAVASAIAIGPALPAKASPCTPWPSCFGAAYQVSGTPDNSLWEWTDSPSSGGTAIRSVGNGYTLWVGCQANDGPQEDGEYNVYPTVPSQTWDFAWDPGLGQYVWVYDWWMNTPAQNAAYNWYSWPDSARHCNFGAPTPQPPPLPTSVTAVPTSDSNIHIAWRDNSGGAAGYLVRFMNGYTVNLGAGATSYDWPVGTGTNNCFTVAATQDGLQSPWSASACATTPSAPWCPTTDPTHPTCNSTGAFQQSCDTTTPCSAPVNDYNTAQATAGDSLYVAEAVAAYEGLAITGGPTAQEFFKHYEDNQGTDLNFDSTAAYHASVGTGPNDLSFSGQVNKTVKDWIGLVHSAADTFDSGYLDYPADGNTSEWQNNDWERAVGHGFYRVVGTRQSDGSWSVHLQLTSYYQFRIGTNFGVSGVPIVYGADMRRLVKIGLAQNFREVGNGTLTYDTAGNPA